MEDNNLSIRLVVKDMFLADMEEFLRNYNSILNQSRDALRRNIIQGKSKCQYCGQYSEHLEPCNFCGAPPE